MATPSERARAARIAAHTKWAHTDPTEGTAVARQAFLDRFDKQVDPAIVDPAERARRAASLRKAYFVALSHKSAAARKRAS